MAQVILFGGGGGGGLWIGPNGVTPIRRFDPSLLLQLRAISIMLHAQDQIGDIEIRRQVTTVVNKFPDLAVSQVESAVGTIDVDIGIVYENDDGGFTCGSAGRPPIPIPWPPVDLPFPLPKA